MIGFGCWFFFLFFPLFNKDDYTEDLGADYYNLGRLKRIYLCVKAGFYLKAVFTSLNIFGHFGKEIFSFLKDRIKVRTIWSVGDLMDLENWNLKWTISRRTPNSPLPTRSPIFEGVGRDVCTAPQMIPDRKWSRRKMRNGMEFVPTVINN